MPRLLGARVQLRIERARTIHEPDYGLHREGYGINVSRWRQWHPGTVLASRPSLILRLAKACFSQGKLARADEGWSFIPYEVSAPGGRR